MEVTLQSAVRGLGWGLIGLAVAAVSSALVLGGWMTVDRLTEGSSPAVGTVGRLHELMLPVARWGLMGLGLVQLTRTPVWRPSGWLILLGAALLAPGSLLFAAAVLAWAETGWGVVLASTLSCVLGGGVLGVGLLSAVVHRRRWPEPLLGATVAAGVLAVVVACRQVPSLVADGQFLWEAMAPVLPGRLAIGVLVAGVVARVARTDGAPPWIDGAFVVSAVGIVLLGVGLPPALQPELVVAGLAAVLAAVVVVAYTVDAVRRSVLTLRAGQPLVLLVAVLWSVGLVGAGALAGIGTDVWLHDTFAEVAASHLLQGLLITLSGLAALSSLRQTPVALGPWLGVVLGCLATGFGALRLSAAFVALGVQGMPRHYFGYAAPGLVGWQELALAGGSTTLGLVLTAAMVGWAAVRPEPPLPTGRDPGSPTGRPAA